MLAGMTTMLHSFGKQTTMMGLIFAAFAALFCFPFERTATAVSLGFAVLFPLQMLLWRLGRGTAWRDYFFSISLLVCCLFLKHFWNYSDLLFYLFSILMGAILRYRVFSAAAGSSLLLETLREYSYQSEDPEEIVFRYVLFFIAGSLTWLLLQQERHEKDEIRKELQDLKFGMEQVDDRDRDSLAMLSPAGQTSRKVDAALILNDSLSSLLQLVHRVFKPETALYWQYLPNKDQLRISQQAGNTQELKANQVVAMGDGPIGWAALNRKTFLQQDRDEGVNVSLYRKNTPIRSFMAVPVVDGSRLEGVVTMDSPHLEYFKEADSAATSFAAQISDTIRMARLAREREERAYEFQKFYEASKQLSAMIEFEDILNKLHQMCAEIVKFDFSAVAVVDKDAPRYALYEWTPGKEGPTEHHDIAHDGRKWISWFMNNRQEQMVFSQRQLLVDGMPLLRENEELESFASFLAIPLLHQNSCLGSLLLASHQEDGFSADQSRILLILGNQAAVSLENSAIVRQMEKLAITDGLTSLFNHRYFQESLEREVERAERQAQPLTLLLMDIDHFKGFNDTLGHPAGDAVLKSLAAVLKKNARKIDILARYGGEEFAALLPGIGPKNGEKTAERWRKAVEREHFKWNDRKFAITLSIGFASYPEDAVNKTELVDRADSALYEAKANGRNKIWHFGQKKHLWSTQPSASSEKNKPVQVDDGAARRAGLLSRMAGIFRKRRG